MRRLSVDLQALPRVQDSWTFLFVEHARIEQESHAILLVDAEGEVPVPAAAISTLLLGPGTSITHAAISVLAECGCSVVWCGEGAVRFYASGLGETRSARNLQAQAQAWANPSERLLVVKRLYQIRFPEPLEPSLSIEQIRGREGVRVRDSYARLSRETGVSWTGRAYAEGDWGSADPVNRALSAANACLYGLCHAAIVATGFSPALGFIHTGKLLSFVYDIADLYKIDATVPAAFRAVAESPEAAETRVRRHCRENFFRLRLLERMVPDIQRVLGLSASHAVQVRLVDDDERELEASGRQLVLWDPERGTVPGGRNYASATSEFVFDPDADDEEMETAS